MEEEGVVSEATALAMARGGAARLGAEVVVAVTGSAGPDPGGAPVGTMVVAVRTPEGEWARTLHLPGDRKVERSRRVDKKGRAVEVRALAENIQALKGVRHGGLVITRV